MRNAQRALPDNRSFSVPFDLLQESSNVPIMMNRKNEGKDQKLTRREKYF